MNTTDVFCEKLCPEVITLDYPKSKLVVKEIIRNKLIEILNPFAPLPKGLEGF